MKRVLLTGAGGFIGRETVAPLIERGFEIHAFVRHPLEPVDSVVQHRLDLMSDEIEPLAREVAATHLLHLAWYAEPGRFWDAPENLDWVAASLRLWRAFAQAGGRRAVVAGSCAEYDWSTPLLDEQETLLAPVSLYGESKAALHRLLDRSAPGLGISLAWGRIFFPFGPFEKPGRLLGSLFDGIARGEPVDLSSGEQQRDFLHVEDVATAFVMLLDSELTGPVNIASGEAVAVREIAEKAAALAGGRHLLRFGSRPLQPDEPPVMAAATERLHHELGFKPGFTLDAGLADMFRRRQADKKENVDARDAGY